MLLNCSTQILTFVGIMKLVEEGKFGLDDKVFGKNGLFGCEAKLKKGAVYDNRWEDITVRHIMLGTSGIGSKGTKQPFEVPLNELNQDCRRELETLPYEMGRKLLGDPGKAQADLPSAKDILGLLIEKYSGMRYDKYVEEVLCKPLGINGVFCTNMYDSPQRGTKLLGCRTFKKGTYSYSNDWMPSYWGAMRASAFMAMPASDFARFGAGIHELLKPETINKAMEAGILSKGANGDFGFWMGGHGAFWTRISGAGISPATPNRERVFVQSVNFDGPYREKAEAALGELNGAYDTWEAGRAK